MFYPGVGSAVYVTRITLAIDSVTIVLADDAHGDICTGTARGTDTAVTLTDLYGRDVGMLIVDATYLAALGKPPAVLEFAPDALPLAAACVVPQPQLVVGGIADAWANLVTGNVWLVGERGVVLAVDAGTNTITVHIIGDRRAEQAACVDKGGTYVQPRFVKRITVLYEGVAEGVAEPNPLTGGITIVPNSLTSADSVLRINNPAPSTLEISAIGNIV